jgi:carbon starvation protein
MYLSMNVKGEPAAVVAKVTALGFPITVEEMRQMADQIGEKTLFGRTGGAATLAVGMAHIFSKAVSGRWLDLWYHFAIMFEALFILTTIDAGTRVGRYLLQEVLGSIHKPLGETGSIVGNLVASGLMVGAWGFFLVQGVLDPLGGINSLWPLFGIANQMLAAIALCLGTTLILKMALQREPGCGRTRTGLALITFIPLIWLLAATMTAGVQKIAHSDPRIGFLAQAKLLAEKRPALEQNLEFARKAGQVDAIKAAEKALRENQATRFNQLLDSVIATLFLALISGIVVLSVREWVLLLTRWKPAVLAETPPTFLPEYAVAEGRSLRVGTAVALGMALAKELSGEAQMARIQEQAVMCASVGEGQEGFAENSKAEGAGLGEFQTCRSHTGGAGERLKQRQAYLEVTEKRFRGVNRCC